ncbi:MAG: hypothetical protein ACI8ZB_005125 [Desulforhopalus sp.]|jgi:hypothetical protein
MPIGPATPQMPSALIAPQGHFFQGTYGEHFVFSQSGYNELQTL